MRSSSWAAGPAVLVVWGCHHMAAVVPLVN
jgi:hypothetical protein